MALLEVDNISVRFGGLYAVRDVTLKVHAGEIVGLIGPNGAGKTTLFNAVTGLQAPGRGSILWKGRQINSVPSHGRARLGIGRTFQKVQVFGSLTVLENVVIAAEGAEGRLGIVGSLLRGPGERRRERLMERRAWAAMELAGIDELADRVTSSLPFGLAKRVELARALAGAPELLLLDEPASGLDASESRDFGALLRGLRDELGVSILLVEHDVQLVAGVSDHVYVLDFGRLIAKGPTAEVLASPEVIAAYLGEEALA